MGAGALSDHPFRDQDQRLAPFDEDVAWNDPSVLLGAAIIAALLTIGVLAAYGFYTALGHL